MDDLGRGEGWDELVATRIPLGRAGTGDDIAYTVVYLCSDQGAWVTGPVLERRRRHRGATLTAMVAFDTPITLTGPWRARPRCSRSSPTTGGMSVHDADTAASLELAGAPIEGPTHFSQFDPLAVELWGQAWFERGCISSHFRTMVVEGEEVQASVTRTAARPTATIEAHKRDGTPVLEGSISLGPDHPPTALEARRAAQGEPGELFILDQLEVGMAVPEPYVAPIPWDESNGPLYPFSLAEKVARITEPSPWYTPEGGVDEPVGPAGRAVRDAQRAGQQGRPRLPRARPGARAVPRPRGAHGRRARCSPTTTTSCARRSSG